LSLEELSQRDAESPGYHRDGAAKLVDLFDDLKLLFVMASACGAERLSPLLSVKRC
jgi:hypothetical protein